MDISLVLRSLDAVYDHKCDLGLLQTVMGREAEVSCRHATETVRSAGSWPGKDMVHRIKKH